MSDTEREAKRVRTEEKHKTWLGMSARGVHEKFDPKMLNEEGDFGVFAMGSYKRCLDAIVREANYDMTDGKITFEEWCDKHSEEIKNGRIVDHADQTTWFVLHIAILEE